MSRPKDVQALFEKVLASKPGSRAASVPAAPAAPASTRVRREARLVRPSREVAPEASTAASASTSTSESRPPRAPAAVDYALTGALADTMAEGGGWKTEDLANRVGSTVEAVRDELKAMEAAGIVYRTGQTRGTRWFIG